MKYWIIYLPALLIATACGNREINTEMAASTETENTVTLTDAQLKNAALTMEKIELHSISSLLHLNGKIEVPPQSMVSISVPMAGYLRSTKLLAGMHVRKGEVIANLEDQQYIQLQQDYLTAKANFVYIENEYLRQKELNSSKASSDKVYEQAYSQYQTQKVLIAALAQKLQLIGINPSRLTEATMSRSISLTSPIDGFVSSVKMNIGRYVSPSDVLFELVNPEDIHLQLTVFEKDINKIAVGQKLVAFNNTDPEKKYHCGIILIGKDVSPERTVQVQCHFENYDKTLIPGMYMNAEVEVATQNAYVIRDEGLVRFEGKQYVYSLIGKNQFQMHEVSTGNSENGYTQIVFADGMDAKDKTFVTKGAYTLLMKMKNKEE